MKKFIFFVLIVLIVLGVYYRENVIHFLNHNDIYPMNIELPKMDSMNIELPKMDSIQLPDLGTHKKELSDKKGLPDIDKKGLPDISNLFESKQTGDEALIQAVIRSDGEAVEKILASGDDGEFVQLFRSLKPQKIYSLSDIARINCNPSPLCKDQKELPEENLSICVNNSFLSLNMALKEHPSCKADLEKYHAVTSLCTLKQNQEVCIQEVYLEESVEARTKRLSEISQATGKCMTDHVDMTAMMTCTTNTPKVTPSQFEAQLKFYCNQAVSCKVFTQSSDCFKKYQKLLNSDPQKECETAHLNALTQELGVLNYIFKNNITTDHDGKHYEYCDLVKDYEQNPHMEDVFARVKTYQDWMAEKEKRENAAAQTWIRIFLYLPGEVSDSKEIHDALMGYPEGYIGCKMMNLPH